MNKINNAFPFLGKRFRYNPNYKNQSMSLRILESQKRYRQKIKDGIYKYEICICFCGSKESLLLAEMDRYGNYYPFVLCKRCSIMRANPRLTEEAYRDFYTYEYRTLYGDNGCDRNKLYKLRLKQAQEVYDFINTYISLTPNAVVFDIGCNMGTMLLPFYQNGCQVMGVDYGTKYIEFGRKMTGLNLEIGGVEKLKNFGKKADLLILNHVLEHFLDLEAELRNIHEVMKPDSFVFIGVPGTFWWIQNICGDNIMGLLQNAHTYQFSLNSLKYVLESCGFKLVYGNEQIKSIFKACNVFRDRKSVPQGECEKLIAYLKSRERKYLPKFYLIKLFEFFGIDGMVKNRVQKLKHCHSV